MDEKCKKCKYWNDKYCPKGEEYDQCRGIKQMLAFFVLFIGLLFINAYIGWN
jgi:hypothetical protein